MPPHIRVPAGARCADSGPAGGRPQHSQADRLDQLSSRLDELTRDIRFTPTVRSHRELERRIAEAEDIAAGIRALFRSPTRSGYPPLRPRDGQA